MTSQGEVVREPSVFVFSADDSDASGRAFEWFLKSLYRDGDEVHLLHVIPRVKFHPAFGVPAGLTLLFHSYYVSIVSDMTKLLFFCLQWTIFRKLILKRVKCLFARQRSSLSNVFCLGFL